MRTTGRTIRALSRALAACLVLGALAGGVLFYATGGRVQIVSSPSMGIAAPVGTLVLTRPATTVAVGDVVTYRPPQVRRAETTTHRVVSLDPGGTTFRTRGDVNGADDPWAVSPADLVGRVVVILPGIGWLVRALPVLLAGGFAVRWAARRLLPRQWAVPVTVLGFSLLMAGVALWLKPFVATVTLASSADAGGSQVRLVSTGVLPIRVTADTGGALDLVPGQVGVLTTPRPPGARGNLLTSGVHMPWWLWLVMTGVWLLPMAYGLVSAWRHPLDDAPGGPDAPDLTAPPADESVTEPLPVTAPAAEPADEPALVPGFSFRVLVAGAAIGLAAVLLASTTTSTTSAAFTARITDPVNTAASNPYFTCRAALSAFGTAAIAWPLDDAPVTSGATARDLDNSASTGTYTGGFTTTANKPCPRDTPARAVTLTPTASMPSHVATSATAATRSANVFTLAVWFRTTTTTGGRLIGWGNARTGQSSVYDRHLYMSNAGQVYFGVYPNAVRTIADGDSYNDGQWHLAVATLSAAGMVLYMDGAPVAADPATTTAQGGTTNTGYWRVGYDNLNAWTAQPGTSYWSGSLSNAAVFTGALNPTQVRALYAAGA